MGHDFNVILFVVDVLRFLVLAGYFHHKKSIKYVSFNELSKNGLIKQENWFETTRELKFCFWSYKSSVHT